MILTSITPGEGYMVFPVLLLIAFFKKNSHLKTCLLILERVRGRERETSM